MLQELTAIPELRGIAVDVMDIDADAALHARYAHKIPVLFYDGELVCHGRLEPSEVHKALAYRR